MGKQIKVSLVHAIWIGTLFTISIALLHFKNWLGTKILELLGR